MQQCELACLRCFFIEDKIARNLCGYLQFCRHWLTTTMMSIFTHQRVLTTTGSHCGSVCLVTTLCRLIATVFELLKLYSAYTTSWIGYSLATRSSGYPARAAQLTKKHTHSPAHLQSITISSLAPILQYAIFSFFRLQNSLTVQLVIRHATNQHRFGHVRSTARFILYIKTSAMAWPA